MEIKPKIISIISTIINLALALLKFLIGSLTHSIALVADALHSGLDVLSSFIAFLGIKKAEKPADKIHPWGYERYESLAGFFIVILLSFSAIWIIYEGISSIFGKKESFIFSFWAVVIILLSIVLNEILARLKFYYGNKFSSLVLVTDAEHSRADVLSSIAVLFGIFFIKNFSALDGILAIIVALYILYESYQLGKEAIESLVDTANPEIEKEIKSILKKEGLEFSEIKTRKIGKSNFAEIELIFPPKERIEKISNISKRIEDKLINSINNLKQVSIKVTSHKFSSQVIKPRFGGCLRFQGGINAIGPPKKGKRVIVPLQNNEIAFDFGASEYLILDLDKNGKVLKRIKIKNPYFKEGIAYGVKFAKSVNADKIITKKIGKGAKENLKNQGIEVEIIEKNKKLNDIKLK